MNHTAGVAFMMTASVCLATSPPPFYYECSLVDRVAAAGTTDVSVRHTALEILERVIEGHMSEASVNLEAAVGLSPGQLHKPEFRSVEVRSHALRKIAELDLPETLEYLRSLKPEQIQPDTAFQMRSAAQIALRHAQLLQIRDEPAKIWFLEDTTAEIRSAAGWWAAQELCNRGSRQSLPFIREAIWKANPTPDGAAQIKFCEMRVDILSRDPDRVKALGSLLTVRSGVTDPELLGWAINDLRSIGSPRADAEVERFANEIERLPDGSPLKDALWGKRVQIHGMTPPRASPK